MLIIKRISRKFLFPSKR